jgi:hypothetical protein
MEDEDALFALLTAHEDDNHGVHRPLFLSDQARRLRQFEPDYRPEYTHPNKPPPGFTFDFGALAAESSTPSPSRSVIIVDDSPIPSTSASSSSHGEDPNTILVCARCLDALVTGDSNTGLEHARRRIWALRCGHLVDGKCVEEIMQPVGPFPIVTGSNAIDIKGKGKALGPHWPDKGKDKEPAPPASHDSVVTPHEHNSMRSRLRPRPHSGSSYFSVPVEHLSPPRPIRPLPHRRQPRGKGKGKARAPVVEAEHQWRCPVAGCAKVHTSLLIAGKWIMDEKTGALAVYV